MELSKGNVLRAGTADQMPFIEDTNDDSGNRVNNDGWNL
jgi:hypothetical protein